CSIPQETIPIPAALSSVEYREIRDLIQCRRADLYPQELHWPRTWTRKNDDIVSPADCESRSNSTSHSSAIISLYIVESKQLACHLGRSGIRPERAGLSLRIPASRHLLS